MKQKKLLKVLLSSVLILSLIMSATVTASAATVKLNKTKASLYAGSSITLKISNTSKKVTWSSSKKSVATVKSTGTKTAKVTAKAAGKATITAKVNGKKYKCTVTVKNKVGTRQNPAIATDGVTITTYNGKFTYKATNIYTGNNAIDLFKLFDSDKWNFYNKYYPDYFTDTKLVVIEYDVKVLSGYDDYALTRYYVLDYFDLYNDKCNASLEGVEQLYFDSTRDYMDINDLSLYGGGSATAYAFILVPDDITAFSTATYDKSFNKYLIKYNLPQ